MPNDSGAVSKEEFAQQEEEYSNTLDALFADDGKSDDEILADLEKKDKDSDKAGEATGDPNESNSTDSNDNPNADEDPLKGQKSGLPDAATNDDDHQPEDKPCEKCAELEAQLTKNTQKMKSWEGRIKAANKRVKELEAKLEAQKDSKLDQDDQEVIDKFKGDFPEFSDAIDVIMKKKASGQTDGQNGSASTYDPDAPIDADDDSTESAKSETTNDGPNPHYVAIKDAHPELEEIVGSGVLSTWVSRQEGYIRPHLEKVLAHGSAEEVIKVISQFKKATGWVSALDAGKKSQKQKKLDDLKEVNSSGAGPQDSTVDMDDFDAGAKEAFADEK